jgi:hypothetical protein
MAGSITTYESRQLSALFERTFTRATLVITMKLAFSTSAEYCLLAEATCFPRRSPRLTDAACLPWSSSRTEKDYLKSLKSLRYASLKMI